MLQSLMKAHTKRDFNTQDVDADRETILLKTPDELAESLEYMMLETRPLGIARISMRGAICMLRDEPTRVPAMHALYFLRVLHARWADQDWSQRMLIVERTMQIIAEKSGVKNAK